jgi:hypothetical protein
VQFVELVAGGWGYSKLGVNVFAVRKNFSSGPARTVSCALEIRVSSGENSVASSGEYLNSPVSTNSRLRSSVIL